VIQLTGYHYHNVDQSNQTLKFLRDTLFKNLQEGTVELPDAYDPETKKLTGKLIGVPIKDLGVSRVWLVADKPLRPDLIDPEAHLAAEGVTSAAGFKEGLGLEEPGAQRAEDAAATPVDPVQARMIEVKKYEFVVQFCWQPKTRTQPTPRRAIAEQRAEQERAAEEAEAAASEEVAATDAAAP
jgi:type IV pilus assembly protein PilM